MQTTANALCQRFLERAEASGASLAVVSAEGSLTYRELRSAAESLACTLHAEGIDRGDVVAISLRRGPAFVVALCALGLLEAVALPLDQEHPAARRAAAIEAAHCHVMITEEEPPAGHSWVRLTDIPSFPSGVPGNSLRILTRRPDMPREKTMVVGDPDYLLFTSGSTGAPKAVALGAQGMLDLLADDARMCIRPTDRVSFVASTAFDAMLLEVWIALTNGAALVVGDRQDMLTIGSIRAFLESQRITVSFVTAGLFHEIVAADVETFAPLRRLMTGGDTVSPAAFHRVHEAFPNLELFNCYGPTENSIITTVFSAGDEPPTPDVPLPIGWPVGTSRVHVLDEDLRPVGWGRSGQICLSGGQLALGYAFSPELTDERFVEGTGTLQGTRLYLTGDRGMLRQDGLLEFGGRHDDQVKIRGYRANLTEIQSVLRSDPRVEDCCVLLTRENPPRLAAYIVPRSRTRHQADAEGQPQPELLSPDVARELADVASLRLPAPMIPQAFIGMQSFPLTANGKVDRAALPPVPGTALPTSIASAEPVDDLEAALLDCAAESLRVRPDLDADLLRAGGDSLGLMRLVAAVERRWGVRLPAESIFASPTPRALANLVRDALADGERAPERPWPAGRSTPAESSDSWRPARPAQALFWAAFTADPHSVQYNCPQAFRIRGSLNAERLMAATDALVDATPVLRSVFTDEGGTLQTKTVPRSRPVLDLVDLSDQTASSQEQTLADVLEAYRTKPFDLTTGPLVRGALILTGADDAVLFLDVHHIVTDGWSQGILNDRLAQFYAEDGAHTRLAEDASQPLERPASEADRAWWSRSLADAEPLRLPLDFPRPLRRSGSGGRTVALLPPELLAACERLAAEEGTSLFAVLTAALRLLLAQHAGQAAPVLGVVVSGRTDVENDDVVGPFVKTLPLVGSINPEEPFSHLVQAERAALYEAFQHADLPTEEIIAAWAHARGEENAGDPARISVTAVMQDDSLRQLQLEGLELERREVPRDASIFDLAFEFCVVEGGLEVALEFDTDIILPSSAEGLTARLEALLSAAADTPDRAAGRFPLATPAEERRILREWNGWDEPFPARPVHEFVLDAARRNPSALAVREAGRSLTYGELVRRAFGGARSLVEAGVAPGDCVPVILPAGIDLTVALLAISLAGAAAVPLDPDTPPSRRAFVVEDTGAAVVIESGDCAASEAETPPEAAVTAEDVAYVVYTSGTTGRPKGVAVGHRELAALCHWAQRELGIGPGDRWGQLVSVGFDPMMLEVWGPLAAGACIVVPTAAELSDPPLLVDWMAREGVTLTIVVTSRVDSVFDEIAGLKERSERDGAALPLALRTMIIGGEKLQRRPEEGWGFRVLNCYGPTEATVLATAGEVHPASPAERGAPSLGRAVVNMRAYIVTPDGRLCPPGVPGELWLGGEGLAHGYVGREDLTEDRFPETTAFGRVYRTGDICRWSADGQIHFVGRTDSQVKIRGHRVETGEIEQVLAESGAPRGTRVLLRSTDAGQPLLVAYIPRGANLSAQAEETETQTLLRTAARALPTFMVPTVVWIDSWPLTSRGKIDTEALPLPERSAAGGAGTEDPLTPAEEALAEAWESVLGTPPLSADESFFGAGGDSILALQLVSAARKRGFSFNAQAVFEAQSIRALAALEPRAAELSRVHADPFGEIPLLPIHRLYFDAVPSGAAFNQSVVLTLRPEVDLERLRTALERVAEAHPALGLLVRRGDDGVRESVETARVVVDHRRISTLEDPDAAVRALQSEPLPSGEGGLFRAVILTGARKRRLVLVAHHLVVDGVSWRVLLTDLDESYAGLADGEGTLAPEGTSCRAWALALERHTPAFREDLQAWSRHVDGMAAETLLAADTGRERDTVETAGAVPAEVTERLERLLAASHRGSMKDALLSITGLSLMEWLGEDEVTVGLEGHGRAEEILPGADLSRTVGWLTSYHPLRLTRAPGWTRETARLRLLQDVEELRRQASAVPNAVGYGVLAGQGLLPGLRRRPQFSYNYLGRFSRGGSAVASSVSDISLAVSPDSPRLHAADLLFRIVDGALQMTVSAAPAVVAPERARELVDRVLLRLHQAVDALQTDQTTEDFPLTPMQQGLLVHSLDRDGLQKAAPVDPRGERRARTSAAYLEQITADIEGIGDPEAFAEAWRETARLRPVARTTLHLDGGGGGHQRVHSTEGLRAAVADWTGLSRAEQDEATRRQIEDTAREGIRLDRLPIMTVHIAALSSSRIRMFWTFPHALLDGWSGMQLFADVAARYAGDLEAAERPRPSFRAFVDWLEAQNDDDAYRAWAEHLNGIDGPSPLPMAHTDATGVEIVADASHRITLSAEETRLIEGFARAERVTLSTVLHGAWALVLQRFTGERSVMFGSTTAGRPENLPGADDMLGLFINTIPVRVDVEDSLPVGELLRQMQGEASRLRVGEHVSQAALRQMIGLKAGEPLFTSIIVFENYPSVSGAFDRLGLTIESMEGHSGTSIPLNIVAYPGAEFSLLLTYDSQLMTGPAVRRMANSLRSALIDMAQPRRSVGEVAMLGQADQESLLSLSTGAEDPTEPVMLWERLERHASEHPTDTMLIDSEGRSVSAAELVELIHRRAAALRERGIAEGDRVAVLLDRTIDDIVSLYAVLRAGGVVVPLDRRTPPARRAAITQIADIRLTLEHPGDAGEPAGPGPWALPESRGPESPAYIVFTSGTTGTPKGVVIPHRGAASTTASAAELYRVSRGTRVLLVCSLAFDGGLQDAFGVLGAGGTLVLGEAEVLESGLSLTEQLRAFRIECVSLPASLAGTLSGDLPDLRVVGSGGEALTGTVARRPRTWDLVNLYGPSETSILATANRIRAWDSEANVPLGRPLRGVCCLVLDAGLRLLPPGAAGELHLAGVGVGLGYENDPQRTALSFRPNPFGPPGSRMYATGDVVRWTEQGDLEFLGRSDEQVKIRGFRVELADVESALRQHPGVGDVVVVARQAPDGPKELVAYVTPARHGVPLPSGAELRDLAAAVLPDYMIPAAVVPLETLPLSVNRKVDKKALPAPQRIHRTASDYRAPASATEEAVHAVWSEVLGIEELGMDDDVFTLGADSLTTLRVIPRISDVFGVTLSPKDVFQNPTAGGLTDHILDLLLTQFENSPQPSDSTAP